jgi:nucleoid-associated protein YgaU
LLAAALVASAAAQAQLKPPATAPATRPAATPAAPAAPAANANAEDAAAAEAGRVAAHAWLLLLDRKDWGTAWDSSSAVFRQTVPLGSWMDAVPKVRAPFGNFVEREMVEAVYKTSMPGRPAGHYVSVMFASKFDKNPQVQEVVTAMREPDGRWRVAGYTAR